MSLLPLSRPFSLNPHPSPYFFLVSPSTCLSSILYCGHTKVFNLETKSVQHLQLPSGDLLSPKVLGCEVYTSLGVSLPLTRGSTVSQGHSVTENAIIISLLSDHCFLINDASDLLCSSKQLVGYPIVTPPSLHKGTQIRIDPTVS